MTRFPSAPSVAAACVTACVTACLAVAGCGSHGSKPAAGANNVKADVLTSAAKPKPPANVPAVQPPVQTPAASPIVHPAGFKFGGVQF